MVIRSVIQHLLYMLLKFIPTIVILPVCMGQRARLLDLPVKYFSLTIMFFVEGYGTIIIVSIAREVFLLPIDNHVFR